MTSFEKFEIHLDFGSKGVAYAGQTIKGQVYIESSSPTHVLNIRLSITGRGKNHWLERDPTGSGSPVEYQVTESYMDHQLILDDQSEVDSEGRSILKPGIYKLPFRFDLPTSCPSSFEGSFGSIRYFSVATVNRFNEPELKTCHVFTVVGKYDHNTQPGSGIPVEVSTKKTTGHGKKVWAHGELSAVVQIPFRGYVPGQFIEPSLVISSTSKKHPPKSISCQLVQEADFLGQTKRSVSERIKHRFEEKIVAANVTNIGEGGFGDGGGPVKTYKLSLEVPPVPPVLKGCTIVSLGYRLCIGIDTGGGTASGLDIQIPHISMGSIPLKKAFESRALAASDGEGPMKALVRNVQMVATISDIFWTNYPNIPEPNFEPCIFGPTNMINDEECGESCDQSSFTPLYAVYK